jgi:hypothetical protein
MRSLVFSIIIVVFIGCNGGADKKNATPETVQQNTVLKDSIVAVKPAPLLKENLPGGISYKGNFEQAWQWNDASGYNILVLAHKDPYITDTRQDEVTKTEEIYAALYRKEPAGYRMIWKLRDAQKNCVFDVTCNFIKGSTAVTDLDNDGVAEATLIYKHSCRSDVSPDNMKLVMFEDTSKYQLTGMMWLQSGPDDSYSITEQDVNLEKLNLPKNEFDRVFHSYGRYETEKDFLKAPPSFLTHARSQWLKFVRIKLE